MPSLARHYTEGRGGGGEAGGEPGAGGTGNADDDEDGGEISSGLLDPDEVRMQLGGAVEADPSLKAPDHHPVSNFDTAKDTTVLSHLKTWFCELAPLQLGAPAASPLGEMEMGAGAMMAM